MSSESLSQVLIDKLNKLRGGPLPPPRPVTPISELPIQLRSEILISTSFLKSYLNESANLKPIVFSPGTISATLALMLSGARNEALDEIENVFGKDLIFDGTCFKGLLSCSFLFYSNKLYLSPVFVDCCHKSDIQLFPVDFDKFEQTLKDINSKISEKTAGKISTIFDSHHFAPETCFCLGSAATFVGQWHFSFPFDKPKPGMFYSNPPRQVEMIRQKEAQLWRFSEGEDWTCMNILYGDAPRNLFIILPKEKDGLEKLVEKFNYSMIRQCIKGTKVLATATIPIFEISSNTILNDKFKKMGIKKLFEKDGLNKTVSNSSCNFNGLDLAVHAARIKVDNFGADGYDDPRYDHLRYENVQIQPGHLCPEPGCREIEFIADRPFIFFVALWKHSDEKDTKVGLKSIQLIGIFS